MKDSYTIHEIAALYGVGPDALRYYEKLGLIRPRRAENGYRIYDLNDIYRLTILRDLRSLGFSMERIGEYLKDLSVGNTLQLLGEERRLIRAQLRALRAAECAIRERVRHLEACASVEDGETSLVAVSYTHLRGQHGNVHRVHHLRHKGHGGQFAHVAAGFAALGDDGGRALARHALGDGYGRDDGHDLDARGHPFLHVNAGQRCV